MRHLVGHLADQLLLVVKWEATPRHAVQLAVRELRSLRDRPIGLVLNMINSRKYARYGGTDHLAYRKLGAGYRRA